ncbi:hypothetical protein EDB81DRAFT_847044 [Dactylonectria macrodidyma]|uniref:NAD(P)-binding domain-containing protein n=1 Tax=Dactylonectria macrodidyma TaxID=307937 RepID=A0A9P9ILH4_9HYPO|nr:hypothetical protein EDB81DRAFT_847044 [Dactylonectria macrodidyma]
MVSEKVLVLSATGLAGICVLRELLHRKVPALAFHRNPNKIPNDLTNNPLLEAIISLLGPSSDRQPREAFANYYRTIIPIMQEHDVRRFLALATTVIYRPKDRTSVSRASIAGLIRVIANSGYHNILAIQEYFETINSASIEWTVYRLGMLSGTSDAAAWLADRNQGNVFTRPVRAAGFTSGVNRSILAKWLVDTALDQSAKWAHQMPAVSNPGK